MQAVLTRQKESGEGSSLGGWPSDERNPEDVNFVANAGKQGYLQSNTYHPGLKKHTNFGLRNTLPNQYQHQNLGASSSGFVPHPHQQPMHQQQAGEKKPSLEEMIQIYMANNDKILQQ